MTNQTTRLLRDAENYLSALHGSVARHDNLAANFGCAGCELRDKIAAELPAVSSAGQAPTTKQPTLPAAAQPPLLAAAFALELDRKESVGEGTDYRRGMARAIKLLRLLNEEAPTAPAGQAPAPDRVKAVAEALEFGSVCCPLCRGTVVLHTPNGARAHFTAVHPDQRITGRGPGPWPLLVASEDEALPALTDPTAVDVVRALHQPDDLGECRECRASSPCPTLRTLDGSATAVVSGRTADETGDDLPAVSSAGQAPTPDRTAVLSDAERQMLNYALNQAQVRMWSVGGFTDEDQAAVVSLRRLADEPAAVVSGRTADETQGETRRETVEYFVQSQQPDGAWESASSFSTDLTFAAERLAARRRMMPDLVLRLAERTTRVSVQALPDCLGCRHWRCKGDGPCGALLDAWQKCPCTGTARDADRPAVGGAQQPKEARP
jgi:hypothetical protein